jgi:uncharacterized protein (DUF2249 family)
VSRHDPVELTVELVHETQDAILIKDADKGDVWLPKSKCEWEQISRGIVRPIIIQLIIPEWLAYQRELI